MFAGLFGKKDKTNSLTGKPVAAKSAAAALGSGSNSGFGGGNTGNQTQKIAATVAANKVNKKKEAAGSYAVPLIGKFALKTQFQVIGTLAGLFFILMLAAIALDVKSRGDISTWTNITSQLQFHTQRLAKSAGLAARGDVSAFPQLQDSRDQFQIYMDVLNNGGDAFNTKVPSAKILTLFS